MKKHEGKVRKLVKEILVETSKTFTERLVLIGRFRLAHLD